MPSKYRCFFPEKYKSHRSHDVLLLCFECNEKAIKEQGELKKQLCEKYNVPGKLMDRDFEANEKLELAKRNAKLLLKGQHKIPAERQQQLFGELRGYLKDVIALGV